MKNETLLLRGALVIGVIALIVYILHKKNYISLFSIGSGLIPLNPINSCGTSLDCAKLFPACRGTLSYQYGCSCVNGKCIANTQCMTDHDCQKLNDPAGRWVYSCQNGKCIRNN